MSSLFLKYKLIKIKQMKKLHKNELKRLDNMLGGRYSQAWHSLKVIADKCLIHDLQEYLNNNNDLFLESIKDMDDDTKKLDVEFGKLVASLWLNQFSNTDFDVIGFTNDPKVQKKLIGLIKFTRN